MPRCWLFAYHEKKCNVIAAPSPASAAIATSSGSNSGSNSGTSTGTSSSTTSRSPSSSAQSSSSGSSSFVSTSTVPGPGRHSFVDKHSNTQIMANMLLSIMDAEDNAELRSSEDAHMARTLSDGPHPSARRQGVDSPTAGFGRQSSSSASSSSKLNGPRESAWHEPPCEEMFLEPVAVARGRHSSASKQSSGRHYSPIMRGRASVDGFLTSRSPGPSRQFGNLIDLSRIEISKLRL